MRHVELSDDATALLRRLEVETGLSGEALVERALAAYAHTLRAAAIKRVLDETPWEPQDRVEAVYEAEIETANHWLGRAQDGE